MFTPQDFVQRLKSYNCCITLLINGLPSDYFSPNKRFSQRDCGHYTVVRFYSKCATLTKAREISHKGLMDRGRGELCFDPPVFPVPAGPAGAPPIDMPSA